MNLRLVRLALLRLAEEPPLALGGCELAKVLLPKERDRRRRGERLQLALRSAIDHLAPIGTQSNEERWAYLICIGEYEEHRTRAEVQSSLAIGPSTYTRAKLAGLIRIAGMLPYLIAQNDAMDDAAWTGFLDTLTPRERYVVQGMMSRVSHILNSDRVSTMDDMQQTDVRLDRVEADVDSENDRIGVIERSRKRSQEAADALHEEVHDLGERVSDLENPHEVGE